MACSNCTKSGQGEFLMSAVPSKQRFVCGRCDSTEEFSGITRSEQLFQRDLSCFCLGMRFSDPGYTITIGSLITYLEPKLDAPVAVVPPDAMQHRLDHKGVKVKMAELSRIYYSTIDPIGTYAACEDRYYELLEGFSGMLETGSPSVEEMQSIETRLDELDGVRGSSGYRQMVTGHLQRQYRQYRMLLESKRRKKDKMLEDVDTFAELITRLKGCAQSADARPPPPYDCGYWMEPSNEKVKSVRRVDLIGVHLALGLTMAPTEEWGLVLKEAQLSRVSPQLIESMRHHVSTIRQVAERYGGNPNRLKQISASVLDALIAYVSDPALELEHRAVQARVLGELIGESAPVPAPVLALAPVQTGDR